MSTEQAPETGQRPGVPVDTFPLRLRLARVVAGDISIEAAAARCGLKAATWSTWERAVHTPPHKDAIALAVAAGLGVDAEWLKHGGPLNPEPPAGGGPNGKPLRSVRTGTARRATRRRSVYNAMSRVNLAA